MTPSLLLRAPRIHSSLPQSFAVSSENIESAIQESERILSSVRLHLAKLG